MAQSPSSSAALSSSSQPSAVASSEPTVQPPLQPALGVALKEWAVVCRALGEGRQIVLLRKGGIFESAGKFELEHRQFLLFPTYLHQNLPMLKPSEHSGFEPFDREPNTVHLASAGVVTDIVRVGSRAQVDAIDAHHVWAAPLIDMRFDYRPKNPLYLMLVRAYRLPAPLAVANTPAYAGCKSWVPLESPVETAGASAVLDDAAYAARRAEILRGFVSAG